MLLEFLRLLITSISSWLVKRMGISHDQLVLTMNGQDTLCNQGIFSGRTVRSHASRLHLLDALASAFLICLAWIMQGFKLHKLIEARMSGDASSRVAANVQLWETHEDLLRLTQIIARS